MARLSCRGWQNLTWSQLAHGRRGNTSFGWSGKEGGFSITHHSILDQNQGIVSARAIKIHTHSPKPHHFVKTSVLYTATPQHIVPASCSHLTELLQFGCLAAWVEVAGEVEEGPELRQQGPGVVAQLGGGARGPEEAWRMGLQAAS